MPRHFMVSFVSSRSKTSNKKSHKKSIVSASSPHRAAIKAFKKLCKSKKKTSSCSMVIKVIEDGKIHKYRVKREYAPKTIIVAGKSVQFDYNYSTKSL